VHLIWSWVCFLFGIAQEQSWMKAKKKRTVAELAAGNADVGQMLGRMPPQDSPVQLCSQL
jgi:spore coat protein U-like protein